jgi:hypothetical protein
LKKFSARGGGIGAKHFFLETQSGAELYKRIYLNTNDDRITQLLKLWRLVASDKLVWLGGSSSAVERQLPKLDVAGSIPVSRSTLFSSFSPSNSAKSLIGLALSACVFSSTEV